MGVKLSTQQKKIYLQAGGSLVGEEAKFSERLLKKLIRWLFFHFPNLSPEMVKTVDFWQEVVFKLTNLILNDDFSGDCFFHLFLVIQSEIEKQNTKNNQVKMEKQLAQSYPVPPNSPLLSTPYPSSVSHWVSWGEQTMKCRFAPENGVSFWLPTTPWYPSRGSKALAVRGPSLDPRSYPFDLVQSPQACSPSGFVPNPKWPPRHTKW